MKYNILTAVAVVAVVVATAMVMVNGDDDKSKGIGYDRSEYALLDSNSNIAAGMTIKLHFEGSNVLSDDVYSVESVSDGKVTYTKVFDSTSSVTQQLTPFKPQGDFVWNLNYTLDSPYPEISFNRDGDSYGILGSVPGLPQGMSVEFSNFWITWTPSEGVTKVSGNMTITHEDGQRKSTDAYVYRTEDGVAKADVRTHGSSSATVGIAEFYGTPLTKYDPSRYDGATITDRQEKFGNVDCTIHTVNGTVPDPAVTVYVDYDIYVYDGYTIKYSGKVNGEQSDMESGIFPAP